MLYEVRQKSQSQGRQRVVQDPDEECSLSPCVVLGTMPGTLQTHLRLFSLHCNTGLIIPTAHPSNLTF